jgi:formate/nitrite transporter FocA (FNT family)
LWVLVLVANIVGAFFFAWLLARTPAFDENVKSAFAEIGRAPLHLSFGVVWVRGIFAGWLIALMVWLLPFAESARIWVIGILTYLIGIGSLTHIIAGSVDVLYLVAAGEISLSNYAGQFMVPTLLGNIVGGVSLVAVLNHAQVTAGKENKGKG